MAQVSDALIRAVVAGDAQSWQELVTVLAPSMESIARSHPAMRKRGLALHGDDIAEVVTTTLERLARDGHRNLSRYLAQRDAPESGRAQSFDSWLYGAVDFVIRDHLRKRYGRAPKPSTPDACEECQPRASRRDLGTNASPLDEERLARSCARALGVTSQLSLAGIFAFVESEFDAAEIQAMRLYYQAERSFAEIASALDLPDARDAERLIRRLNARLRHRFAAPDREEGE